MPRAERIGPSMRRAATWRGRAPSKSPDAHLHGAVLTKAWAEFLGRIRWEVMVTLTFDQRRRFPVGRDRAIREAVRWANTLAYGSALPICWLVAAERGRGGSWHSHVLIVGADDRAVEPTAALWRFRNGLAYITPVYDGHRLVVYATKADASKGHVVVADTIQSYLADNVGAIAPMNVIDLHPVEPAESDS